VSLIATSFAADTPLWITSLVRREGVHFVWQFWAPAIGSALAVVLFARMWRRLGVLIDPEMVELRYSGRPAAVLRLWNGFAGAAFFCPLILGWVVKAMEIITTEAMELPDDSTVRIWTTIAVLLVAVIACSLSGFWGVVVTDFRAVCPGDDRHTATRRHRSS
jgi:SSS family solute:Na+ symporter